MLLETEFLEIGATDPRWYRSHPRSRPGEAVIPNTSVSLDKFLDPPGESCTIYFVRAGIVSNLFPVGSLLHTVGEGLLNELMNE